MPRWTHLHNSKQSVQISAVTMERRTQLGSRYEQATARPLDGEAEAHPELTIRIFGVVAQRPQYRPTSCYQCIYGALNHHKIQFSRSHSIVKSMHCIGMISGYQAVA